MARPRRTQAELDKIKMDMAIALLKAKFSYYLIEELLGVSSGAIYYVVKRDKIDLDTSSSKSTN